MVTITNEFMYEMLSRAKPYTLVILKSGPNVDRENLKPVVFEHARRNFAMREEGILSIVCPIRDGSDIHGIGIFNVNSDETKRLMDEDPGVIAGIFTYEIHETRSFPGDKLPE